MHYLFCVTTACSNLASSFEARTEVLFKLSGFDRPSWWDWLSVGGRGSGRLSHATWAREAHAAIRQRGVERLHAVPPRLIGEAAWAERIFSADMPASYHQVGLTYWRNPYRLMGYEDDAVVLSPELYDQILVEFEGQNLALMEGLTELDSPKPLYIDLDGEAINRDFIGQKWLITVDAHF